MLRSFVLACMLFIFASAAFSQERRIVETAGLFCKGVEHVETFVYIVKSGKSEDNALAEVNKIAGGEACFFGAAFVVAPGEKIGDPIVIQGVGSIQIVEITVVGVPTKAGPKPISPMTLYIAALLPPERS